MYYNVFFKFILHIFLQFITNVLLQTRHADIGKEYFKWSSNAKVHTVYSGVLFAIIPL